MKLIKTTDYMTDRQTEKYFIDIKKSHYRLMIDIIILMTGSLSRLMRH